MTIDSKKPTEVGFADFTSQLIYETFQAVINSILDQEKEIREMERIASLELEEFSRQVISDETLRTEILRLFPSKEGQDQVESCIDPGSVYIPQKGEEAAEEPPVSSLTSYKVTRSDIRRDNTIRGYRITKDGSTRISETVRQRLAMSFKDILLTTLQKGIPRIFVDHGRINTKLSFNLTAQENQTESRTTGGLATRSLFPRLTVKPVNNKSPEFLTLRVNVVGEVDITFKTITL